MIFDQRPVWLHRQLLNWHDVYRWGIDAGIEHMMHPEQLHATLATARQRVDWSLLAPLAQDTIVIPAGYKPMRDLGSSHCIEFDYQPFADRHFQIASTMSIDFPNEYIPHVSVSSADTKTWVAPSSAYEGELVFGPEVSVPFIANIKIPERPINRNDVRLAVGLPEHDDEATKRTERAYLQKVASAKEQERRTSYDYEDDDEDDDPIVMRAKKLLRR